jgi:tetrahydromethanopterin S-methyltransferase subunit F
MTDTQATFLIGFGVGLIVAGLMFSIPIWIAGYRLRKKP